MAECLTLLAVQNVTGTILLVTPLCNSSANIIDTNSTSIRVASDDSSGSKLHLQCQDLGSPRQL